MLKQYSNLLIYEKVPEVHTSIQTISSCDLSVYDLVSLPMKKKSNRAPHTRKTKPRALLGSTLIVFLRKKKMSKHLTVHNISTTE